SRAGHPSTRCRCSNDAAHHTPPKCPVGNGTFRKSPWTSALELDVVLDADPGEHGHFVAPQPVHGTAAAISRQPCALRRDARPAGAQKLADLARGHTSSVRAAVSWRAGPPAPLSTSSCASIAEGLHDG